MSPNRTIVLNSKQINQKLNRIAYQIYENNYEEKEIILAGIVDRGYHLAERIRDILTKISPLQIQLLKIELDKLNPLASTNSLKLTTEKLKGKVVILVDDVLNSGKTLIYGVRLFLDAELKKLSTAVLVDRNHKNFPVEADYVGLSMATTMQEHVFVELEKENCVYLQ